MRKISIQNGRSTLDNNRNVWVVKWCGGREQFQKGYIVMSIAVFFRGDFFFQSNLSE
jgi:hypothetical protein